METMEEQVILVDEHDKEIGTAGKLAAHRSGRLHRAITVFVFSPGGETYLQQRADGKYHSAGLWSNTCCSHPRPGETVRAAAERRLREEMGMSATLEEQFTFTYRVEFPTGLIEHELDHVLFGRFDGDPTLNPDEAKDWRLVKLAELVEDIAENPDDYSYWLKECLPRVVKQAPIFLSTTQ